ncbi:hypothetical protein MMC13_003764 [Lambiella insularis]|nr:hypothetical protein [Lambiella insularis]
MSLPVLDMFFKEQQIKTSRNPRLCENEYQALEDLFSGKVGVAEATRRFAAGVTIAAQHGDCDGNTLWTWIWSLISDAAKQLPDQHHHLADFVVALQRLPGAIVVENRLFQEEKLWSELPGMQEYWRDLVYINIDCADPDKIERCQDDIHINLFTAKLSTRVVSGVDFLEPSTKALIETLEIALWDENLHAGVHLSEDEQIQRAHSSVWFLNLWIPLAANLITISGDALYRKEGQIKLWVKGNGRTKWKGREGFSKERWMFWKECFQWVSMLTEVRDLTRALATRAEEAMDEVERKFKEEVTLSEALSASGIMSG